MDNKPLLEYEECDKSELGLDDKALEGLGKYLEKNDLSAAITFTATGIKATSYVGVIKYKKTQIEILPKLIAHIKNEEGKISDEERKQIIDNLLFMLSYTKKLNIKTSDSAKLSQDKNPFLEVLIREYAVSLIECLKRLTPKNYIREEENLNYLKGKLLFTQNLKYNCANKAKFYCEYDEFSENCILNQLFYFVAQCLYTVTKNSKNKQLLKMITDYFCDIKFVKFNSNMCEKIKLTRQQQLFEKPFKLAKMFVEHSSVDLSKNKFENITLLWDMNKLFEEFIYQVIRRKINDQSIKSVAYQAPKKLLNKGSHRHTKADIIAEKTDGSKIIIDTKYKKLTAFSDVAIDDLYQVGMYCQLHDEPDIEFDNGKLILNETLSLHEVLLKNKEYVAQDIIPVKVRFNGAEIVLELADTNKKQNKMFAIKQTKPQPKTILLYPSYPNTDCKKLNKNYNYNTFTKYEVGIRTVDFINLKESIKKDLNSSESQIVNTLKDIITGKG